MQRKVQILVEGRRLELFNDEKIEVNSSVQNIADISKVFTDFSQSFSIPCSDVNNQIFQHFYQTDVDSTIDHNIRRDAVIEIDLTFFRRGKLSIEKANVKKGDSESYQVTFYGDVLSLKDKFGEDLLSNLDYDSINHNYTGTEVVDRVTDGTTDYEVRYPLISSKKIWQYGSVVPNGSNPSWYDPTMLPNSDISTMGGAIEYNELFPAVKISKMFDLIESKYGLTFNGTFLTNKRFTNMYLWMKNKDVFDFMTQSLSIDLTTLSGPPFFVYDLTSAFDLTNNKINIAFLQDVDDHLIKVKVISKSAVGTYWIDIYQDGNLWQTLTNTAVHTFTPIVLQNANALNTNLTFKVRSDASMTLDFTIEYGVTVIYEDPFTLIISQVYDYKIAQTNSVSLTGLTDLSSVAPKMKVSDFFAGIIKEFNLTCYPTDVNTYQIEPLGDWYSKGAIIDITEYTDVDSIDIERIKLFKKIAFRYQASNSFMNKYYKQQFSKEYGDATFEYNYDGGEFLIEQPFENLLFNKFTGTDLQVAYSLDPAFAPYVPSPCLIYQAEQTNATYKIYNGTSIVSATTYVPFGQDLNYQNINYSSNFAPETSTLLDIPIQQSLFATYYFSYLTNLFNLKNRLTSVKTNLPISLTTGLKLNDRVIIRDKRYIINEMKLDLTTGEANFTLLNDFAPLIPRAIFNGKQEGDDIIIPIVFPNGTSKPSKVIGAALRSDTADIIINPDSADEERSVIVTVPPVAEKGLFVDDEGDYIDTEEGLILRTEEGDARVIVIFIDYTFEDGTTTTQEKYIVQ
jgi:hypothetical protein